jgi:hypothetical protein
MQKELHGVLINGWECLNLGHGESDRLQYTTGNGILTDNDSGMFGATDALIAGASLS